MIEEAQPKTLTVSEALAKVAQCTCPPSGKARKWYDAAKALADEIQALRNREARIARRIEAAEREEATLVGLVEASEPRRRPLCGVAEKVRFASHDAARRRIATIRSGDPLRAYFCDDCDGWHLTHERKRKR